MKKIFKALAISAASVAMVAGIATADITECMKVVITIRMNTAQRTE